MKMRPESEDPKTFSWSLTVILINFFTLNWTSRHVNAACEHSSEDAAELHVLV